MAAPALSKMPDFSFLGTKLRAVYTQVVFIVLASGAGLVIGVAASQGTLGAVVIAVLLAGGALALSAFSSPVLGLLALIVITYLRLSDILVHYHHLPSIAKPLVALLLGLVIMRWALYREEPVGWPLPLALISAYAIVILLSLFFAANFNTAIGAVSDFIKDGIITVLVVMLFQKPEDFRKATWALLFVGIYLGTLSVYQYLTGDFGNVYGGFAQAPVLNIVGESNQARIAGPIGDPNFYAQIMVTLVPLALNRLFTERRILWRLLALWATVVITLTVFFTFSRGGFLALVVSLLALAWYYRPSLPQIAVFALLGLALLPFLPAEYTARLSTLTNFLPGQGDVRNEVSFRGRTSEWIVAGLMFADHPLFGVGIRNYPEHYLDYSSRLGLDPRRENREPHSFYLEIAAESGLAGLLVFTVIFGYLYRSIKTARQTFEKASAADEVALTVAFGAAMLAYLSAATFIHGAYPRYFWLLLGIGLALPQAAQALLERQNER
ncbi:MAG: hypothetical protein Fur0018_26340 [Anaerolineales bacterium]